MQSQADNKSKKDDNKASKNDNLTANDYEAILYGPYEVISNLLKENLDKLQHTLKKIDKEVSRD